MTPEDVVEILSAAQELFNIYEPARIDFNTDGGILHAKRVLNSLQKYNLIVEPETLYRLYERVEKTPTTGAKMVDALIVEIIAAAEGETASIPSVRPENFAGCGLCHGGVVVLPFADGNRAVYCDCGRGQFLWGANGNEQACLANRPDLKAKAIAKRREEEAKAGSTLIRFGIDPDLPEDEKLRLFRAAIVRMKQGIGQQAKPPAPAKPVGREQARAMLTACKRPEPPDQLNPERVALAVYANGDERNEWE